MRHLLIIGLILSLGASICNAQEKGGVFQRQVQIPDHQQGQEFFEISQLIRVGPSR
jgi:hypothetical protein